MPQSNPAFPRSAAVEHCLAAARAAFAAAESSGKSISESRDAEREAYMRSMPDLSCYENIREFIACVTYGMVNDYIFQYGAKPYLYAAQVALSAVGRAPKASKSAAA